MSLRDAVNKALHVECPVHRMRDCGALLNGCRWPVTMREQADALDPLMSALLDVADAARAEAKSESAYTNFTRRERIRDALAALDEL